MSTVTIAPHAEEAMCKAEVGNSEQVLRALLVIPAGTAKNSYIFSRRQAGMLQNTGVNTRMFFVQSRMAPLVVLKELFRLRSEIRRFQPHVVHAQYGTMTAFLTAMACQAPLVVTFRGSDLNPVPSCNRLRIALGHLLSQLSAIFAKAVICVSQELQDRLWWTRAKSRVIVGGVNLELFVPMPREEARARLGWQTDRPTVLFNAGKHPKIKGLDLAEEAIEHARPLMPELEFVVLNGDVEPDSMPLYYNAADCILITSRFEGSPTVLKEAMACNLPVVSVDVGDVKERLGGVTRSAVVARDPKTIAAALVMLLQSIERSRGRQAVQDLCEFAEAKRIRDLYQEIASSSAEGWA